MMNLAEGLDINAKARPDHIAIIDGERSIDYASLARLVRQTAGHIESLSAPDDIIGICLKDSLENLVLLYAVARAGRVILPMDIRWTNGEKQRVAAHFGAHFVVAEPDAEALEGIQLHRLDADWQQAVAGQDPARFFENDGEASLLVSLSSGTTGRPKGPMITHRHFFRRFMTHWINLGLNSRDCFICATPLYFGGGRTFCMSVLFSGGTVVMFAPPFEPEALIDAVQRHEATSMFLVPTQIRRLLELPESQLAPMQRMGLLISSGSPLTPQERSSIKQRLCAGFSEYYASTEGGGVSLLMPQEQASHGSSVGRPVFGVEVEIVDDTDKPLAVGQVGKLRYRGPGVADGYFRDPEASLEAFRDGWFYPGDLAERDAQGYVYLRGRSKDMIIRGGVNIYPAEIEAVLMAHPDVIEAVVVAWPSREFGEEIAAFVKLRNAAAPEALVSFCQEKLARYKKPKRVFVESDFPRNSSGKVLKAQLVAKLPPLT